MSIHPHTYEQNYYSASIIKETPYSVEILSQTVSSYIISAFSFLQTAPKLQAQV